MELSMLVFIPRYINLEERFLSWVTQYEKLRRPNLGEVIHTLIVFIKWSRLFLFLMAWQCKLAIKHKSILTSPRGAHPPPFPCVTWEME